MRLLKKMIFALVAAGLVLVGLEAILRSIEVEPAEVPIESPMSMQKLEPNVIERDVEHGFLNIAMDFSDRFKALPYPKKAGTFRVFVFGGSAAMGLGFPHNGSFSRWLDRMLQAAYPDLDIEVVNLAAVGFSSTQVRALVDKVLEIGEPDLLVVYSGNNEYLDVKAGLAMDKFLKYKAEKARGQVQRSFAIVRFIDRHLPKRKQRERALEADEREIVFGYLDERVSPELHETTMQRYRQNLAHIALASKSAGVPIVLSIVLSNPIHALVEHSLEMQEIRGEKNALLVHQAYGWYRLGRADLAEKTLTPIDYLGPRLDLLAIFLAGGVREIDRLPTDVRERLLPSAEKIIDEWGNPQLELAAEKIYSVAIAYKLLGKEKELSALIRGKVNLGAAPTYFERALTMGYYAQFADRKRWKKALDDLWRMTPINNIATPRSNEVVRKTAAEFGAVLVDWDREIPDWYEPSPLRFLTDYCHFNIEGAFTQAELIFKAAKDKGALPQHSTKIDFRATLLDPTLEWLRTKGVDFPERDKWFGFSLRACYVYSKPITEYWKFDQWLDADKAAGADPALVRSFESNRRWYNGN